MKALERKPWDCLKKEWLLNVACKGDEAEQNKWFNHLIAFLQGEETVYEMFVQLKEKSKPEPRRAWIRASSQLSNPTQGYVVGGDSKHKKRLHYC